jgi:hypothetical protein
MSLQLMNKSALLWDTFVAVSQQRLEEKLAGHFSHSIDEALVDNLGQLSAFEPKDVSYVSLTEGVAVWLQDTLGDSLTPPAGLKHAEKCQIVQSIREIADRVERGDLVVEDFTADLFGKLTHKLSKGKSIPARPIYEERFRQLANWIESHPVVFGNGESAVAVTEDMKARKVPIIQVGRVNRESDRRFAVASQEVRTNLIAPIVINTLNLVGKDCFEGKTYQAEWDRQANLLKLETKSGEVKMLATCLEDVWVSRLELPSDMMAPKLSVQDLMNFCTTKIWLEQEVAKMSDLSSERLMSELDR